MTVSRQPPVLVTGSSRGIGFAIAQALVHAGIPVLLHGRDEARLKEARSRLPADGVAGTYRADLSSTRQRKEFLRQLKKEWTHLRGIVHNAGEFISDDILQDKTTRLLTGLFEVHAVAIHELTVSLLPLLIPDESRIILINSIAGLRPYLSGSAYAVAKSAQRMLGYLFREALKPHHIPVTLIYPGATWTDSWKGSSFPEERFIPPEDIGFLVACLFRLSARTCVEEIVVRPIEGDL